MQTIIEYPETQLDGILAILGYTPDQNKQDFLTEKMSPLVIQSITDVFVGIKNKQIAEMSEKMPSEVKTMVTALIKVKTI